MKLSIIIPALNEENYLPKLLSSLHKQKIDCETIVANSQSTDRTVKIARINKIKVINVRRGLPSYARNDAVKICSGELIIFLDADILLPKNFLKKNLEYFKTNNLDIAGAYLLPIGLHPWDWFTFGGIANIRNFFGQFFSPTIFGGAIFVKKSLFNNLKGFNEKINFGEDIDFVRKAVKNKAKFEMLPKIAYVSMRRYDLEGRLNLTWKYAKLHLKIILGNMQNLVHYDFGKF